MNEIDLAWTAGIYEGEGYPCVYFQKNGYPRFQIGIQNTDYSMLKEFKRLWKGTLNKTKNNYKYKDEYNRKDIWTWKLLKQHKIKNFCRLIYPYLRTEYKIKQLEEAWVERGWDINYLKTPITPLNV